VVFVARQFGLDHAGRDGIGMDPAIPEPSFQLDHMQRVGGLGLPVRSMPSRTSSVVVSWPELLRIVSIMINSPQSFLIRQAMALSVYFSKTADTGMI